MTYHSRTQAARQVTRVLGGQKPKGTSVQTLMHFLSVSHPISSLTGKTNISWAGKHIVPVGGMVEEVRGQ
jgi:hypothetical protein